MGSDPKTEAGRRLLGNMLGMRRRVPVAMGDDSREEFAADIRAIEEEAARLVSPADREGQVAGIWDVLHKVDIIDQFQYATDEWWFRPEAGDRLYDAGLRVSALDGFGWIPPKMLDAITARVRAETLLAGQREDAPLDAERLAAAFKVTDADWRGDLDAVVAAYNARESKP